MQGSCRLCHRDRDLRESHIIPQFVYTWLKETSLTPTMRESRSPNKRVQDGVKRYWLCADCEQQIGDYERQFSLEIFHPLAANGLHKITYGDWLLKFCVSVSWRVLLLACEQNDIAHIAHADEALKTWRGFLRGDRPHPAAFEQHCIPFGTVDTADRSGLPANINRYVLRAIEIDIAHADDFSFSYAKMGPVAVLGFTELKNPKEWPSSKVHVRHGQIGGGAYCFPQALWRYWEDKARRYGSITEQMSERQQSIANQSAARAIETTSPANGQKSKNALRPPRYDNH
jgi:hypothetical protein